MFHFIDDRLSIRQRFSLLTGILIVFACTACLSIYFSMPKGSVVALACFVVAIALLWKVANGMETRIGTFHSILARLANNGETITVPYLDYKNESGGIASTIKALQTRFDAFTAERDTLAAERRSAAADGPDVAARTQTNAMAMNALCNALNEVANENLAYRMTMDLPPEWKQTQDSFNQAVAILEGRIKAHEDAASQHEEKMLAAAKAHEEAVEKANANTVDMMVSTFGEGLSALSRRELKYRMTHDLPEEYRILQTDFNAAATQLEEAMIDIDTRAADIARNAADISQASQEMAQRTERQAAALEESAAALNQITSTVGKSAENAKQANETALGAKSDAEHGGLVTHLSVEAMHSIAKSSSEIGQIVGLIDEIAFQTNLLSLNASVEAARAGDAGKGFAVVASEVRSLAQRSAEAAKKIKTLIKTSEEQVGTGVKLVEESGAALEKIVEDIGLVCTLMSDIAAAQNEQAVALSQIDTAVGQMDQMTQQNAAMAEESTAASESLATHANELAELVDRFEVTKPETPKLDQMQKPKTRAA